MNRNKSELSELREKRGGGGNGVLKYDGVEGDREV